MTNDNNIINKDDGKRSKVGNAINDMANGYEQIAKERNDELPKQQTTADILREKYNENPDSLNASQKLILGFANIEDERKAKEDNE